MNKSNLGIKALNLENWMSPDPLMSNLVSNNKDTGSISIMRADDWAASIFEHSLTDTAPTEVLRLFEVARGTMLYGYFFYPLYTLGFEQLTRVTETAINYKCQELGRNNSRENFAKKIQWLAGKSIITDISRWDELRILRNEASHPKYQTIIMPAMALNLLANITECINSLFVNNLHI